MTFLRRQEAGFTLVELLVATTLALVVIGVSVMLITSALSSEPRSSSRSGQIEAGRIMLERVTREMREGCRVAGGGAEIGDGGYRELSVFMDCESDAPTFTYDCEGTKCQRTETETGKSELMVSGLEGEESGAWPVFVLDNENYVEVQLRFPRAEGGESVTLSDGVAMRNQLTGPTA